jgi:hypothetical protein
MDIDRRRLLTTATCALLTGVARPAWPHPADPDVPAGRWHPLTRSLLDRARCAGTRRETSDMRAIERVIGRLAESKGRDRPLVIKWMDTPTGAFDHLRRTGLDALLDMGTTSFWRRSQPPASRDAAPFYRAFEVRMLANELLGVQDHDAALMAPKLLAKSRAMSANEAAKEIFHVRAVSSQIGWLETSMADAAAQAVSNVELLLSSGTPESSAAIDNQVRIFEVCELGLLATWETPDALICVACRPG